MFQEETERYITWLSSRKKLCHTSLVALWLRFQAAVRPFKYRCDGMLCHELRDLDIAGKQREWLHEFLKDRSQAVAANVALSLSL